MYQADVCVYHDKCDDGFGSAWIVRKRWPQVRLAAANYGLPFPDVDIVGKNLLMVDFSYNAGEIEALAKRARSVVILDHHKTAEVALDRWRVAALANQCIKAEDIDGGMKSWSSNCFAYFDMERSGVSLACQFCFPGQALSKLLAHIEDRDLWRFKLPKTKAISRWLQSYPYDFDVWGRLIESFEDSDLRATMIGEAESIERFYDRQVAEIVPTATLKDIGKWKNVPVAYASYAFVSDVAHALLKANPAAPFAAVVVDAYGSRTWSLRSEDSRQDVSEVAKQFGGGGHRNASGFRVPV